MTTPLRIESVPMKSEPARIRPELPRAIVPTETAGISRVLPALPCADPLERGCRAVLVLTGWMEADAADAHRYTCPDCFAVAGNA